MAAPAPIGDGTDRRAGAIWEGRERGVGGRGPGPGVDEDGSREGRVGFDSRGERHVPPEGERTEEEEVDQIGRAHV